MNRLKSLIPDTFSYLWSGWGALASLLLFCAAWELAGQHYGSLILPGPLEVIAQLKKCLIAGLPVLS